MENISQSFLFKSKLLIPDNTAKDPIKLKNVIFNNLKEKQSRDKFLPMAGVARVWRPTSWAGPRPSRKSLNWLSEAKRTPGKIRLKVK